MVKELNPQLAIYLESCPRRCPSRRRRELIGILPLASGNFCLFDKTMVELNCDWDGLSELKQSQLVSLKLSCYNTLFSERQKPHLARLNDRTFFSLDDNEGCITRLNRTHWLRVERFEPDLSA